MIFFGGFVDFLDSFETIARFCKTEFRAMSYDLRKMTMSRNYENL
eukprot:Gb_17609 [translate_table: standard]